MFYIGETAVTEKEYEQKEDKNRHLPNKLHRIKHMLIYLYIHNVKHKRSIECDIRIKICS